MQPKTIVKNYGPKDMVHDTGTWSASIAAGFLQAVKAAGNEAGNSCIDVSLPVPLEREAGRFQGYAIKNYEIQYVVGTANLDAAPTLKLYRERMGSSPARKEIDTTAPTMGLTQTTHTHKVRTDDLGGQSRFHANDKAVLDFAWDAALTSVLSITNVRVEYEIFES